MQTGLDARIEVLIELYRRRIELLATIPGVSPTTAPVILADITQFPSAGHLASWARICPGHHESAGKHTSRTTRPGDPWLMGVLRRAAISAARGKNTYLAARYRRLVIRRGRRRALVALQHSILIAAWHMFTTDMPYRDLGAIYFVDRASKRACSLQASAVVEAPERLLTLRSCREYSGHATGSVEATPGGPTTGKPLVP